MTLFLPVLIVVAAFFILMSTRILLVKNGEFKGTCASNNPMVKTETGECGFCGAKPEEVCKNPDGLHI